MKPLEQVIRFWVKKKKGRKHPKDEKEALILHDEINQTSSCWECPNRLHCEWAIDLLKKNIEFKEKMKAEKKEKAVQQEESSKLIFGNEKKFTSEKLQNLIIKVNKPEEQLEKTI